MPTATQSARKDNPALDQEVAVLRERMDSTDSKVDAYLSASAAHHRADISEVTNHMGQMELRLVHTIYRAMAVGVMITLAVLALLLGLPQHLRPNHQPPPAAIYQQPPPAALPTQQAPPAAPAAAPQPPAT